MQRLLLAVILAIILTGLPLLALSDTDTPTADTAISNNEVTGNISISEGNNSSASATITITMYTGDAE